MGFSAHKLPSQDGKSIKEVQKSVPMAAKLDCRQSGARIEGLLRLKNGINMKKSFPEFASK